MPASNSVQDDARGMVRAHTSASSAAAKRQAGYSTASTSSKTTASSSIRYRRNGGQEAAAVATATKAKRASSSAVVSTARRKPPPAEAPAVPPAAAISNVYSAAAGIRTSPKAATHRAAVQDAIRARSEEAFRPSISEASRFMASFTRPRLNCEQKTDSSIHERLYKEAEAKRKKKEEIEQIVSAAEGYQASKEKAQKEKPRSAYVEEKLYSLAETRRQQMRMVEAQAHEHLRSLRDAPKLGARSKAVYRQKLYRDLRAAVDCVQPYSPGCPAVKGDLLSGVFQLLGIFRENHLERPPGRETEGSRRDLALQERKKPTGANTIAKQLLADYRTSHEKALAARVVEKLDVECSGHVPFDRLFSFLAAVTTQLSALRTPAENSAEQLGHMGGINSHCLKEASKELQSLGLTPRGQTLPSTSARKFSQQHEGEVGDIELLQQLDKEMSHLIRTFGFLMVTRERKRECLNCSADFAAALVDAMEGATFHPHIDPQSEIIATKYRAKVQQRHGPLSLPDRLVAHAKTTPLPLSKKVRSPFTQVVGRAHAVAAVKEKLRAEQAEEELKNCTFHPKIKPLRVCSSCSTRDLGESHMTWSSLSAGSESDGTSGVHFKCVSYATSSREEGTHTSHSGNQMKPSLGITRELMCDTSSMISLLLRCRDPSVSSRGAHSCRRLTKPKPFSFADGRYKVQLAAEVFTMTVEVGKGKQGKMSVREGEDPRLVARGFCRAYSLQAEEAEWLTGVLVDEMKARNLISFVPDETGFGVSPVARRKESLSKSRTASSDRIAWDSPMQRREGYSSASPSARSIRVLQRDEQKGQNQDSDSVHLQGGAKCNSASSDPNVFFSSSSSSSPPPYDSLSRLASAAPSEAVRARCYSPKRPLRVADFAGADSHSSALPRQHMNSASSHSVAVNSPRDVVPSDGKSVFEARRQGEADVFYSDAEDKDETTSNRRSTTAHTPSSAWRRAPVDSLTEWQIATPGTAYHVQTPFCRVPEKGDGRPPCPSKKSTSASTAGADGRKGSGDDRERIYEYAKTCVSKVDQNATVSTAGCVKRILAAVPVRKSHAQEQQRPGNGGANTVVVPLGEEAAGESAKGRNMYAGMRNASPWDSTREGARGAPTYVQATTSQPQQQQENQQHPQVSEESLCCFYDRSNVTENSGLQNILRVTNIASLELSQPLVPPERSHALFPADSVSRTEAAAATPTGLPQLSDEDNEHSPLPTTLYSFVDRNTDAQSFASVSLSADEADKAEAGRINKKFARPT